VLFFYGIGIQYGKAFVEGLSSRTARRQNGIAIISTLAAGLVTAGAMLLLKIPAEIGSGLFAGALVNTAALDSVINKLGNDLPVVGYGVAYPFGVFGPIFCIYAAMKLLRPKLLAPPHPGLQVAELLVSHSGVAGKLLSEVMLRLPPEVQVIAVRQDGHNRLPRGDLRLSMGDELMIEGEGEPLQQARRLIGEETPIDMLFDRHDLTDLTVYVSKPSVIGQKLGDLRLLETLGCTVISIARGNSLLYPQPGLVLEAGDQVRVVTEPSRFDAVSSFFGNSAYSTAEVSYLALGIGMVLGVLFGLIPFPLPGLGQFTFGAAGGAMIVSLLLGWRGRIGPLCWHMPPAANLTLRNFGLTLFLAVVGLRSAQQFVTTVQQTGFTLLGTGIAITLTIALTALGIGYGLMRLPFDQVLGVIAGVTGNPAILAYASKAVPTNQPELGYAIVFPLSTIIKIIVVQVILAPFVNG
jgi:putative transport protein